MNFLVTAAGGLVCIEKLQAVAFLHGSTWKNSSSMSALRDLPLQSLIVVCMMQGGEDQQNIIPWCDEQSLLAITSGQ